MGGEQLPGQRFDVLAEVHVLQIIVAAKPIVDQRHGLHAELAIPQHGPLFRVGKLRLHVEQAGYDLQVVLNAMMHFFHQRLLNCKSRRQRALRSYLLGDIDRYPTQDAASSGVVKWEAVGKQMTNIAGSEAKLFYDVGWISALEHRKIAGP